MEAKFARFVLYDDDGETNLGNDKTELLTTLRGDLDDNEADDGFCAAVYELKEVYRYAAPKRVGTLEPVKLGEKKKNG